MLHVSCFNEAVFTCSGDAEQQHIMPFMIFRVTQTNRTDLYLICSIRYQTVVVVEFFYLFIIYFIFVNLCVSDYGQIG